MVITPQPTKRPDPTPGMPSGQLQPDFLSLQTLSFIPANQLGAMSLALDPFQASDWLGPPGLGSFNFLDCGPPMTPALFPNMGSQSSSTRTDEDEDEEDEGERDLDVDHFLDFSEDSEDEPANDDAEEGETTGDGQNDAAKDGSGADGDKPAAFNILSHLGGMNVGAFRRQQMDSQLIARGEATPESLSFSNPLFNGTLRGIRDGALPAAATSLTPERRRKPQSAKSPLEIASLKRRSTGMADSGAHKKHKSISDVGSMQI